MVLFVFISDEKLLGFHFADGTGMVFANNLVLFGFKRVFVLPVGQFEILNTVDGGW